MYIRNFQCYLPFRSHYWPSRRLPWDVTKRQGSATFMRLGSMLFSRQAGRAFRHPNARTTSTYSRVTSSLLVFIDALSISLMVMAWSSRAEIPQPRNACLIKGSYWSNVRSDAHVPCMDGCKNTINKREKTTGLNKAKSYRGAK